jgi:TolA-binding protein
MNRLLALMLMVVSLFWAGTARASADSTCYPDWKVKHTDRSGCSSTALISPGNDTRVNLLMLLHDRHGAVGPAGRYSYDIPERRGAAEPFGYSVFALTLGPSPKLEQSAKESGAQFLFGTRCMSSMAGGTEFIAGLVRAKGVPADERATLAAVRTTLKPECIEAKHARSVVEQAVGLVKSKQGRLFARYLVGAAAFYDGDFAGAKAAFASIVKPESAWLAEAASYMLGRTALNAAMVGAFDEYGSLATDSVSSQALAAAETGFTGYLTSYPGGQYAASARGLLRRVY